MNIIPQVTKSTPHGERGFDIYSRLLEDRIIMLDGEVNDQTSSLVISQLLYLNSVDKDKDISLYINSQTTSSQLAQVCLPQWVP